MTPSPVGPPPRWISFDCYGTLIDWELGIRRAFRDYLQAPEEETWEMFRLWERVQWEQIRGPYLPYSEILWSSFRQVADEFGYLCPGYARESLVESVARWEPFPDANAALTLLARCYRLAIISNTERHLLGASLRHLAVRFDALITAEDVRAYKPNPAMFQYAVERLNCPPTDIVHVAFGAAYDLQPAHSLGFRLVYLNRSNQPAPQLPLEAAIRSLTDLPLLWS